MSLESREQGMAEFIERQRGKTIAVVYQHTQIKNPLDVWYHRWGMSVISFYGYGLEALGVEAVYCDIDSFVGTCVSQSKRIDGSINLICGNRNINNWLVVPSVSSWYGIDAMPCPADALLAGERKDIASAVAHLNGFNCPRSFPSFASLPEVGIFVAKPRDFGSSVGVRVGTKESLAQYEVDFESTKYVFQEYVEGIDITVPVIYDVTTSQYMAGNCVAMVPHGKGDLWIFGEKEKGKFRVGTSQADAEKIVFSTPQSVSDSINALCKSLGGGALGRVDFRVAPAAHGDLVTSLQNGKFTFIEINPIPTLTDVSGYATGLREALQMGRIASPLYDAIIHRGIPDAVRLNCFVVLSMLGWAEQHYIHE